MNQFKYIRVSTGSVGFRKDKTTGLKQLSLEQSGFKVGPKSTPLKTPCSGIEIETERSVGTQTYFRSDKKVSVLRRSLRLAKKKFARAFGISKSIARRLTF